MIFRTSCVRRSSKWSWKAGRALLYDGICPARAIKGKLSELCALIGPTSHTRLSRAHCYTCRLQLESEGRGSWSRRRARPRRNSWKLPLWFACINSDSSVLVCFVLTTPLKHFPSVLSVHVRLLNGSIDHTCRHLLYPVVWLDFTTAAPQVI